MNNEHRWTDDESKRLIGLWLDGAELDRIAESFGTTRYAINKHVQRLRNEGIPLPRRNNGHKAGRRNKLWTQSEVEFLIRRRNENATAEQIAIELDRSFLAVQGMIQKLRKEEVEVKRLGQGSRRLWDAGKLKATVLARKLTVAK